MNERSWGLILTPEIFARHGDFRASQAVSQKYEISKTPKSEFSASPEFNSFVGGLLGELKDSERDGSN